MYTPALQFLFTLLGANVDRARREEGASAVEWVVIAAILVAITLGVGLILRNAITGQAENIGRDIENA